jgi:hypothetical protein
MSEISANDLLYAYQTDFDVNGNFVLKHEVHAQIVSFDAKGKPIVSVSSGAQYLTTSTLGMRFVRIGNTTDATRQAGIINDSLSSAAPRIILYDGLDASNKLFTAAITKTLIGNLDGHYGYSSRTYGFAAGPYSAGHITVDATNGIRIRNSTTDLAKWDASGNITIGEVASGKSNIYITSGALRVRNNTTDVIELAATGNAYFKGMIELSGSGGVKITNAGVGANGFVIDVNGIRGYSSTLGLVFDLPTNGTAPTFSSGKIKEVEFEIYTSGVIRTSATVGDGSANSAGLLMNNTGFYACKASQLLANANVKIMPDGTFSFNGDANNKITWNGTTLTVSGSITLTNTISADSVVDGSTNKAYTGTEKTKLTGIAAGADVTLSAVNGGLSLTGGGLTLTSGGASIKSGQSAYDTGTGFWLGLDSTTPKFSIGNSAGNKLLWDGTALNITGTISGSISTDVAPNTRIQLRGAPNNDLGFYNSSSLFRGAFYVDPNVDAVRFDSNFYVSDSIQLNNSGASKFIVNSSGQITKVNNLSATAKHALIGDGTSFTPRAIAATDIDANVSNTEFSYLDGVTSAIQTQLNGKVAAVYGSMRHANSSTTIASDQDWEFYTGFVENVVSGCTVSSDKITAGSAGVYRISYSITFTPSSNTGNWVGFDVFINSSNSANETGKRAIYIRSTDTQTICHTFFATLAANDVLDLRFYSADIDTITVAYADLSINKISS